jgi:hypothetical protein
MQHPAPHRTTLILHLAPNSATTIEKAPQVHLVDAPHQLQIRMRDTRRDLIERGTADAQQLALPGTGKA